MRRPAGARLRIPPSSARAGRPPHLPAGTPERDDALEDVIASYDYYVAFMNR